MRLHEFAPGSGDSREPNEEEILHRLASQWWQGDEDPRAERTLAAMGWEIGQDEGYDNGGVFVVRAGDINGDSYTSIGNQLWVVPHWPEPWPWVAPLMQK